MVWALVVGCKLTWVDAFDVIGEMTFSKQLGFLQQGRDVEGIIMSLEKMFDYAGKVGCKPTLCFLILTGRSSIDWSNALA